LVMAMWSMAPFTAFDAMLDAAMAMADLPA
jgi:hypothetical protein